MNTCTKTAQSRESITLRNCSGKILKIKYFISFFLKNTYLSANSRTIRAMKESTEFSLMNYFFTMP